MLLKRLMAALVATAFLAAMAVPALAQNPFGDAYASNFLDQDQWCEQFNYSTIDQTQVQNGVTQIGGPGSYNVNYGDVDQFAVQKAEPKQVNICAQLGIQDWNKDKKDKDKKDKDKKDKDKYPDRY